MGVISDAGHTEIGYRQHVAVVWLRTFINPCHSAVEHNDWRRIVK